MEVIQWISLWNTFKEEFENEKNMLGGSLGDKAAEDLRQRIIEHVVFLFILSYTQYFVLSFELLVVTYLQNCLEFAEHPCCLKILLEDYNKESCKSVVP